MSKGESETVAYSMVNSPVGRLFLASTKKGLCRLHMGGTEREFTRELEGYGFDPVRDDDALGDVTGQLDEYFAGDRTEFTCNIDLSGGTDFQRRVWNNLLKIDYGQVRSYKWMAREVGSPNGYRAVGSANGANPIAIIVPCHRVVNESGNLGGYGGGLDAKRALLRLEGAQGVRL